MDWTYVRSFLNQSLKLLKNVQIYRKKGWSDIKVDSDQQKTTRVFLESLKIYDLKFGFVFSTIRNLCQVSNWRYLWTSYFIFGRVCFILYVRVCVHVSELFGNMSRFSIQYTTKLLWWFGRRLWCLNLYDGMFLILIGKNKPALVSQKTGRQAL